MIELAFKTAPLWLFALCAALGLVLHVLVKIDAWWKPEFAQTGIRFWSYFADYPLRSAISAITTLLVSLLLWEYGVRDALAATAAGYIGNSMLDGLLGQRTPK